MPDIQTEMQKILQAWDQPEPPQQHQGPKLFAPTNNVTKETFNFIRDNAGCTRTEVIQTLVAKGHKKSSVSSLIGQMLRQKHIVQDGAGLLHTNGKEYTPIKSAKTVSNREKKAKAVETLKVKTSKPAKKYKVKDVPVPAGIAALMAEHKNNIRVEIEPIVHDRVQQIMDTISLSEAKRLFKALNDYFNTP